LLPFNPDTLMPANPYMIFLGQNNSYRLDIRDPPAIFRRRICDLRTNPLLSPSEREAQGRGQIRHAGGEKPLVFSLKRESEAGLWVE
jgi:hypothetical protein